MDKVKGGKTSNLNEALHHLIWSTVSKTTAIDLDLMHFGASLAVIRYNDGFSGILELVEMLGLVPGHTLIRHCNVVDKDRLYHSEYQIDTIYPKRRYSIKKSRRRAKRIGDGYKSGTYSFVTKGASASKVECCKLCGGDDDSGVLSSSRKVSSTNIFDWISCEICLEWFHVFCLNNLNVYICSVEEEGVWICPQCQRT